MIAADGSNMSDKKRKELEDKTNKQRTDREKVLDEIE
jgi:hypothetical protein